MAARHYAPAAVAAAPSRERILLCVLFVTVLASSVAIVEPSPHDGLMALLALAALISGVRFNRTLLVPFVLLLLWNLGGLWALFRVIGEEKTIQYAGTSVYLAVAAMVFAALFAQNTMPRLTTMRVAYVAAAVAASLLGIAGYFNIAGTGELLAPGGRALALFKDPNVYSPFLIWPALFTLDRMVARRIHITDVVVAGILLFGLLLSFSRGAWFHFAVSCLVMIALAFLTAPTNRERLRVLTLSAVALGLLAAFVVFLLSFSSISTMFTERAQLIQSYDVGSGGRFQLQELAIGSVLNFPGGMGPFEFSRVNGLQQHNVYLQAFLVYGWGGAMAYILLLLSTVLIGLRAVFVRTPWQPYLITAIAAFIGEMAEGFVIDTDHWRHFFLLLGMVWGLTAATFASLRRQPQFLGGRAYVGAA
ncbi:MAG TPA: O-antigen ligase family protein [Pseudolabrys sp.]|nr:O-antigen ligase family protein [Pseudolabrys sp.]